MKVILTVDGRQAPIDAAVVDYVNDLGPVALRSLVFELAVTNPEAMRVLQLRAAPAGSAVQQDLMRQIDEALSYVDLDYRDPYHYEYYSDRDDADERFFELLRVLDEVERHLDAGQAEQMLPVLYRALTGVRRVGEEAEEPSGLIDSAVDRVATLYARACRDGHPDPVALARGLVDFRADSPGWFDLRLDEFAPAFDEPAWAAYREAIDALDAQRDPGSGFDHVSGMLLELADRDGDVDRAIELLQRHHAVPFDKIIGRLRGAGREADALAWLDRAVGEDRLTDGWYGWIAGIDASLVADMYLAAGRADDAINVLTRAFKRRFALQSYQLLVRTAARVDREVAVRAQARELARANDGARADGRLVRLLLADNDLDAAWEVADEYGAGNAWTELAKASEDEFPVRSADLYRPALADALQVADTKRYASIAEMLATRHRLYHDAGLGDQIDAEIRGIRAAYRRRPSLMAAMDKARLPH